MDELAGDDDNPRPCGGSSGCRERRPGSKCSTLADGSIKCSMQVQSGLLFETLEPKVGDIFSGRPYGDEIQRAINVEDCSFQYAKVQPMLLRLGPTRACTYPNYPNDMGGSNSTCRRYVVVMCVQITVMCVLKSMQCGFAMHTMMAEACLSSFCIATPC